MGRLKLPPAELTKVVSVCLKPTDRAYIESKYGNLSEAARLLVKDGPYEQLLAGYTELENKLKNLNK
jgi:hypothetical protein